MNRRGVWIVAVIALAASGWYTASRVVTPVERAALAAAPTASTITAPVERRILSDVVVTRGDVIPESAVSVAARSEAIVTKVPVSLGASVVEGSSIVELSGRPVFVIAGAVPIYRDLRPGSTGEDVAQLQNALARFGFEPAEHDGVFGPGTMSAVRRWYLQTGYQPAQTSEDATNQLRVAATNVRAAEDALAAANLMFAAANRGPTDPERTAAVVTVNAAQRAHDDAVTAQRVQVGIAQEVVNVAHAALERTKADPASTPADLDAATNAVAETEGALTITAASAATAAANTADDLVVARSQAAHLDAAPDTIEQTAALAAAQHDWEDAVQALSALEVVTGEMVPMSELVVVPSFPVSVVELQATVGAAAGAGPVMTLTTGGLVVRSWVDDSTRQLIRAGQTVTVDAEFDGISFSGHVLTIASEPQSDPLANFGPAGFPVIISPEAPLNPSLSGRNVRVTITNASSRGMALVVPEAALFARADGTVHVTRLDGSAPDADGEQVEIEVRVDLAIGGFAAVTVLDGTLEPGNLVVIGGAATGPVVGAGFEDISVGDRRPAPLTTDTVAPTSPPDSTTEGSSGLSAPEVSVER